MVEQPTPQQGAERDADTDADDGQRDRPPPFLRGEQHRQHRKDHRKDDRRPHSHHGTGGDHDRGAVGPCRAGGRRGEQGQADQQQPAAAVAVTQGSADQHQSREHQHVGVDDPLQNVGADHQLGGDGGQRHVHDRDVEPDGDHRNQ